MHYKRILAILVSISPTPLPTMRSLQYLWQLFETANNQYLRQFTFLQKLQSFSAAYRVDLLRNYTAIVLSAFVTAGLFEVHDIILLYFLIFWPIFANRNVCNFGVELGASHHYVWRFCFCSSDDSIGSVTSYGKYRTNLKGYCWLTPFRHLITFFPLNISFGRHRVFLFR